MKRIFCKIDRCLACRSCELACAAIHEPRRPRIHVEAVDEKGMLHRMRAVAVQCRRCEEPACAAACISGGIHKDETTGDITVDLEKCVGCWSCIMVCPIGAIKRDEHSHRILKCDSCASPDAPLVQDAYACIAACPTGALILYEETVMENG